mmetsp:Transcript_8904/g.28094  ORF Transcript_8904/g.28094 Transcript_8904/m.28094 type:complete len:288 (+) Transcript_8904:1-864(+)
MSQVHKIERTPELRIGEGALSKHQVCNGIGAITSEEPVLTSQRHVVVEVVERHVGRHGPLQRVLQQRHVRLVDVLAAVASVLWVHGAMGVEVVGEWNERPSSDLPPQRGGRLAEAGASRVAEAEGDCGDDVGVDAAVDGACRFIWWLRPHRRVVASVGVQSHTRRPESANLAQHGPRRCAQPGVVARDSQELLGCVCDVAADVMFVVSRNGIGWRDLHTRDSALPRIQGSAVVVTCRLELRSTHPPSAVLDQRLCEGLVQHQQRGEEPRLRVPEAVPVVPVGTQAAG